MVSSTPRPLYPRERTLITSLIGGRIGTRAGLHSFGEQNVCCTCKDSNPGPSSRLRCPGDVALITTMFQSKILRRTGRLKREEDRGAGENRIMNNLVTFQHTGVIRSVEHFMGYTCVTHGTQKISVGKSEGKSRLQKNQKRNVNVSAIVPQFKLTHLYL